MKVVITSQEELDMLAEQHEITKGISPQKICLAVIIECYASDMPSVTVKIHKTLLASSYLQVPSMFARSMVATNPFPHSLSSLKGEYMVVRCSSEKIAGTFRARIKQALKENGRFRIRAADVPLTYRKRPGLIAKALTEELCQDISYKTKDKYLIWITE